MATKAKSRKSVRQLANPSDPDFQLTNSPFYALSQVNGKYTLAMEQSLKAVGMDLPRWRVLMVLHEHNPSTISEISRRSVMKLSTMTKVAQRLEKEGYVKLKANQTDRRVTDVFLLSKGDEAVETIRRIACTVYSQATNELTDKDLETLLKLLDKLERALAPYQ